MKRRLTVLIFSVFVGMILAATQPASLYAGSETGGGAPWEDLITSPPKKYVSVSGPLSIYLDVTCLPNPKRNKDLACYPCCPCENGTATMFYTVRLSDGTNLYTYEGSADGACLGDFVSQGDVIMNFLGTVIPNIFGPVQAWGVKSVENVGIPGDSLAFVADITIWVVQ
jgi:hypothetical protein